MNPLNLSSRSFVKMVIFLDLEKNQNQTHGLEIVSNVKSFDIRKKQFHV